MAKKDDWEYDEKLAAGRASNGDLWGILNHQMILSAVLLQIVNAIQSGNAQEEAEARKKYHAEFSDLAGRIDELVGMKGDKSG